MWDKKCSAVRLSDPEEEMDAFLNVQKKLAPELAGLLQLRYNILRQIMLNQPVGRRALAQQTAKSERVLRSHVDFLKSEELINFSHFGMSITPAGREVLEVMSGYMAQAQGISRLEELLPGYLPVKKVVIAAGDSDREGLAELGDIAAAQLCRLLAAGEKTVAVSGGSTMLALAEAVKDKYPAVLVAPARGGLGGNARQQANSIAALLAGRLDAKYCQLYIPDAVSPDTLAVILSEDRALREAVETMKNADVMVHGIGSAVQMAQRRELGPAVLAELKAAGAIGEALGKYFTIDGKEVQLKKKAATLLDNFSGIGAVMAVAGGKDKAEAVIAVCRAGHVDILVTDWAAAAEMSEILQERKKLANER